MALMVRLLILLACCVGLIGVAAASEKAFPFAYDQHDYPNGLRLITIPTDFPNVVSVYIVVQTGSRNEVEPGKSGFAHFFEHMMFRGTKTFPTARYEATLKEVGAASNAYTTDDHTAYHTTFSKEDLETVLMMEADRFQNLEYAEDVFRTEALAVLGEYNKNSASPTQKLFEVLRDTAFDRHTYKHTTMGFLRDIEKMPTEFEYSKLFFDRYYRPEYTTLIVCGDVTVERSRALVNKYWGQWKRGSYRADIPAEPAPKGARVNHVKWPTPTLPWVAVAFRGPAYSDTSKESVALNLVSFLGFSESSALYKKLVIDEQRVDVFTAMNPDRTDPYLFIVLARVKKADDVDAVRDEILATLKGFTEKPVSAERLVAAKSHLRYRFALAMDNSEAIAAAVTRFVALRRTPETINNLFALYGQVTPEDVQNIARQYFVEQGRTVVTLGGGGSK